MIRLITALLSRRPRPTRGGAAAPDPLPGLTPAPYSSAWHQRRAHRAGTAVHMGYGRFLIGRTTATAEELADLADTASDEWAKFAAALRAEDADVIVPRDLSDLEEGDL
ncbi:hypothetical protein [Nocardiopsis sp. NRRL B-16309]|uniref:hypothetical protein n=1 Tax=Nocardiopsis sp. NRRL B-16309 TaxID=1519494 RepID=UPI0006AE0694|nr:hypothetical protein [Nocardiopsis sp. NRRL B-16309]KOX10190.1 hypothetical protein ADL05_26315 [Nocardiopsis sp. NRRL B-16309]